MGAARVIQGPAAWRRARRAAAVAAALLTAAPAAARAQEDTVRVEWALSSDGTRVILNAYPVRGGKPVLDSIRGLRIDRDPASATDRVYDFAGPNAAYAFDESRRFLAALGLSEVTLDTLANKGETSGRPDLFDVQEWTRLLNRLLVEGGTVFEEGSHRLVVKPTPTPASDSLLASDLAVLFEGQEPNPLLPHLASGRIAVPAASDGLGRADSIESGSTEGAASGFVERFASWLTGRWGVFVLLALMLGAVVAWKMGATLRWMGHLWPGGRSEGVEQDGRNTPRAGGPEGPEIVKPEERETVSATADPAVHRLLTIAFESLQGALELLGTAPGSDGGDGSSADGGNAGRRTSTPVAEKLRRLTVLEQERDGFVEERSELRERVRTLDGERTSLEGQVRTLREERASLERQVASLEGVRGENERLRAEVVDAGKERTDLRQDVQRITEERETLGARLGALSGVLELSDEMLSDAAWPETQRRLPGLRDGGKPRYLWNFEQLVADLTAIFEEIEPRAGEGRLATAASAVLAGSNQNAGLRSVAAELKRETLAKCLGLAHPRELRTLPAERFYRDFVDRRFRPVIDNIAKLGLYARSRSPEIGMGQRLAREGVDPALLERALALVETRMCVDFGVEVQSVHLFEERFDRSRHDTAAHSTLRHTLPDLDASIRRLAPETIYDITSVGFRSDRLGVSVRPVVAWVTPH